MENLLESGSDQITTGDDEEDNIRETSDDKTETNDDLVVGGIDTEVNTKVTVNKESGHKLEKIIVKEGKYFMCINGAPVLLGKGSNIVVDEGK